MSATIGYICLILWLFVVIAPFYTFYGSRKIINDNEIKKINAYSIESLTGLFPYRKRLKWIAKNYLAFPTERQKLASRIIAIDRLTLVAMFSLLATYIIGMISGK